MSRRRPSTRLRPIVPLLAAVPVMLFAIWFLPEDRAVHAEPAVPGTGSVPGQALPPVVDHEDAALGEEARS